MTYLERIKELSFNLGMTLAEFQEKLGLSSAYFFNTQRLTAKVAKKIQELQPDINIEWIQSGKGSMFNSIAENSVPDRICVYPISMIHNGVENFNTSKLNTVPKIEEETTHAFRLTGDNMIPEFPSGTLLFTTKVPISAILYGRRYVVDFGDKVVCCHIKRAENENELLIWSPNPEYPEYPVAKADIKGLYWVSLITVYL